MADTADSRTPEQLVADQTLADAGFEPGLLGEDGKVIPEDGQVIADANKPPEPPAPAAEPVKPAAEPVKPKWTDQEVEGWKDRAGWAEREKTRADAERERAERAEQDAARLRAALGTPTPPQPTTKTDPEDGLTDEDKAGLKWLRRMAPRYLPELLSEILPSLPVESLSKHPALVARDVAIFKTRERVEQGQFLSQFPFEKRRAIAERILPGLEAARRASGFKDSYDDLWERQRKAVQDQAELYGVASGETPAAPKEPPVPPLPSSLTNPPPTQVPPTLAGVRGGSTGRLPPPQTQGMTEEDFKLMGLR